MMSGVTRVRESGLELARMLATLLWVAATAAIAIGALDALPGWIAGEDRAAHRVRSIDEAERALRARVLVPGVFPARLAWPPAEVRIAGGARGSVALAFEDRDGAPALVLVQSTEPGVPPSPALLGDGTVLSSRRTTVGPRPATLSTVVSGGRTWSELAWQVDGRALVLRGLGDLDELYRIAHSTHGEGRR
jgi:hypothetical protein